MKYPKLGKTVKVTFLDNCHQFMASEIDKEDFIKREMPRLIVHGKVIGISRNYIYIATNYPEFEDSENGYNITGILKNCIDEWE